MIRLTTGNRVRKTIYGNLVKAISEREKLKNEVIKKEENKSEIRKKILSNITLEEAVSKTIDYLIDLAENTEAIDLNTVYDYQKRINTYVYDYFPRDFKISTFNEDKVKDFLRYLFRKEKKNGSDLIGISSIEKIYSALRWVIRYCSEIADPPLMKENCTIRIRFKTLIPKGRGRKKRKDRSHSLEELKKISEAYNEKANIRLRSMVSLILDVGCRGEECLGLTWNDVNLETGEVNYKQAVTSKISKKESIIHGGIRIKELKSKDSYRVNFLSNETLQCLKKYKKFKMALGIPIKEQDHIFTVWCDNTVLSPISFADEYKTFNKKYGFDNFPMYDIRHSVINILLESGISPKDVAQYVGNTPRTLLESYTEIRQDKKIEIRDVIVNNIRLNTKKIFNIDDIVYILNCDDYIDSNNLNALNILDFVSNSSVAKEDEYKVIEYAKRLILEQNPNFKIFCNSNEEIVKAKLDTYKEFNNVDVELEQNPNYFLDKIIEYKK